LDELAHLENNKVQKVIETMIGSDSNSESSFGEEHSYENQIYQ
jgi:hypothetical protein